MARLAAIQLGNGCPGPGGSWPRRARGGAVQMDLRWTGPSPAAQLAANALIHAKETGRTPRQRFRRNTNAVVRHPAPLCCGRLTVSATAPPWRVYLNRMSSRFTTTCFKRACRLPPTGSAAAQVTLKCSYHRPARHLIAVAAATGQVEFTHSEAAPGIEPQMANRPRQCGQTLDFLQRACRAARHSGAKVGSWMNFRVRRAARSRGVATLRRIGHEAPRILEGPHPA